MRDTCATAPLAPSSAGAAPSALLRGGRHRGTRRPSGSAVAEERSTGRHGEGTRKIERSKGGEKARNRKVGASKRLTFGWLDGWRVWNGTWGFDDPFVYHVPLQ